MPRQSPDATPAGDLDPGFGGSRVAAAPVQARSKATYRNILAAAGRLLESDGLSNITIQKVADAAGVDARLVRYYFGDLEGLVVVVSEFAITRFAGAFREMIAGHDDPRDAIRELMRTLWRRLTRPERRLSLVVQEIRLGAARNETLRRLPRKLHEEIEGCWVEIFEAAEPRFDFAVPPAALARMLYDAWDGIVGDYLTTGDAAKAEEAVEGFITAFCLLIAPRG